jgi:hypothetical protein
LDNQAHKDHLEHKVHRGQQELLVFKDLKAHKANLVAQELLGSLVKSVI